MPEIKDNKVENHVKADLLLVLTSLVAASGWIFSKEALNGFSPLTFIGLRFFLAGLLLSVVSFDEIRLLSRQGLFKSMLIGVLLALAISLWVLGLANCSHMGEGAFILSLGGLMVPVIACLFFGDRPHASVWLSLPVALIGLFFLTLRQTFQVESGQIYFFVSAIVFALLFNVISRFARTILVRALAALQVLFVGILVLPLGLLFETLPEEISISIFGWLAASAIIATALRYTLQIYGQRLSHPSHAALILMLEPVWTAGIAAYWYGEIMNFQQLTGCTIIIVAVIISRWEIVLKLLKK